MSELTIGNLIVQMSANVARLQTDMGQATRVVSSATEQMVKAAEQAKRALELIGIGLGAREIIEFTRHTLEAADSLYLMSQKVGIAVGTLTAYQLAIRQSGMQVEEFGKGMKNLSVYMAKHEDDLKSLGVTSQDTSTAFQQLANVFQALPDGYQKTALAQEIFKKSGIEMIPILNRGAEGLQESADKSALYAQKLALLAPLAHELNDKIDELKLSGGGLANTIGLSIVPVLIFLVNDLAEARNKVKDLKTEFDPLAETIKAVAILGANVSFVFTTLGKDMARAVENVKLIAKGDFAGSRALGALFKTDAEQARKDLDAWTEKLLAIKTGMESSQAEAAKGTDMTAAQIKALQDTIAKLLSKDTGSEITDGYDALATRINQTIGQLEQENAGQKNLTEGDKIAIQVKQQLSAEHQKMVAPAMAYLLVQEKTWIATEARIKQEKTWTDELDM